MKTVLITGASRGIGAATAEYFGERGWRVICGYYNNEEKVKKVAEHIENFGGEAHIFRADISKFEDCQAMAQFAESFELDLLVNNAGVSEIGLFTDITAEREKYLFDIDLFAPMNLSKLVLPNMIRKKSGSIINISSMWGQVGASCEVHYSTAKAGIIGFTKALAKEVAPSGIRVNCVAPGVIDTEMNAHLSEDDMKMLADEIPMCRIGSAREVAECVYFLAESSYLTGQVISPNGGLIV